MKYFGWAVHDNPSVTENRWNLCFTFWAKGFFLGIKTYGSRVAYGKWAYHKSIDVRIGFGVAEIWFWVIL